MKKLPRFFLLVLAAWVGGFTAQTLMPRGIAEAAGRIFQADQVWVYGPDGKQRIQMATYPNAGEKGYPLMGFSDSRQRLRLLLRLAGPNESPVMIFKDVNGSDRMVLGLNYQGGDEAPFIQK